MSSPASGLQAHAPPLLTDGASDGGSTGRRSERGSARVKLPDEHDSPGGTQTDSGPPSLPSSPHGANEAAYLQQFRMATVLEEFVAAAIVQRPDDLLQFGAAWFASQYKHRDTPTTGVPEQHVVTPSKTDETPIDAYAEQSAATSPPLEMAIAKAPSPELGHSGTRLGQSGDEQALDGSQKPSPTSRGHKEKRPTVRTLKRLFAAPPVNDLVFDDTVPPREGHYGIVRRAKWKGKTEVAVKTVPIEANWTIDEYHHLQYCQVPLEDGSGNPETPGTPHSPMMLATRAQRWDVVKCFGAFYDAVADRLWYIFEWIDHNLVDLIASRRAAAALNSVLAHVTAAPSVRRSLEREAAYIARNLLHALAHVHTVGRRVHLDVKPANILLRRRTKPAATELQPQPPPAQQPTGKGSVRRSTDAGGRRRLSTSSEQNMLGYTDYDVVLADFGTAQELTTPLQQLGDFKYMAPEVYFGAEIPENEGGVTRASGSTRLRRGSSASNASASSRSALVGPSADTYRESNDVWSVGIVVIYCLEGFAPFDGPEDASFGVLRSCWVQPTVQHPLLWSPQLSHFLSLCFERDSRLRPSVEALLAHEWLSPSASE
jgi:serine/threonine protein kinase